MKVKELKEFINSLDDDFDIELNTQEKIPQNELDQMDWKYPYRTNKYQLTTGDVGYSNKVVQLWIDLDKPIEE